MPVKRLALTLLCLGLISCRSFDTMSWGECPDADGAGQPTESIALVDWSQWPDMITKVDAGSCVGFGRTGYKSARLSPGKHVLEYSNHVPNMGHIRGRIELEVKKGHAYEFRFDTCFWCMPVRYAVWVDDKTTGELAWGTRRDWPAWYL